VSPFGAEYGIVHYCTCSSGHISDDEGMRCFVEKGYKQVCGNPDELCDLKVGLTCQNKRCRCSSDAIWDTAMSLCYSDEDCNRRHPGTFYNKENKKCEKKIKTNCDATGQNNESNCPTHAVCSQVMPGHFVSRKEDFVHMSFGRCVCNVGFVETHDNKGCAPLPGTRISNISN